MEYLPVSQLIQCVIVVEADFEDTSTLMGFDRLALCSLATLVVIVAENRYVFLSFGMTLRILSMIGPKSISRSRSASSNTLLEGFSSTPHRKEMKRLTRYFNERNENPLVFSRWSISLPGVATTM